MAPKLVASFAPVGVKAALTLPPLVPHGRSSVACARPRWTSPADEEEEGREGERGRGGEETELSLSNEKATVPGPSGGSPQPPETADARYLTVFGSGLSLRGSSMTESCPAAEAAGVAAARRRRRRKSGARATRTMMAGTKPGRGFVVVDVIASCFFFGSLFPREKGANLYELLEARSGQNAGVRGV